MADSKNDVKILRGATAHNIVLKGGGYATIQRGEAIPDNISPESLQRLIDSGVLDNELTGPDWQTLAKLGTAPAPGVTVPAVPPTPEPAVTFTPPAAVPTPPAT